MANIKTYKASLEERIEQVAKLRSRIAEDASSADYKTGEDLLNHVHALKELHEIESNLLSIYEVYRARE